LVEAYFGKQTGDIIDMIGRKKGRYSKSDFDTSRAHSKQDKLAETSQALTNNLRSKIKDADIGGIVGYMGASSFIDITKLSKETLITSLLPQYFAVGLSPKMVEGQIFYKPLP